VSRSVLFNHLEAKELRFLRSRVASPASYRYYRLNISANNGDGSFTDLSELGLAR
jgi:hypothetical protein